MSKHGVTPEELRDLTTIRKMEEQVTELVVALEEIARSYQGAINGKCVHLALDHIDATAETALAKVQR